MTSADITLISVIGGLAIFTSILLKIVGYPDQILKNFKRKSTEGISTAYFILAFLSYFFITIHGLLKSDWVVIITQGSGVITTGLVLTQIVMYKKRPRRS